MWAAQSLQIRVVTPPVRYVLTARQWARLSADIDVPLRRGAWYRVLELRALEVVLDVKGAHVTVPRPFTEIVGRPPRRWTVVPRPRPASHRHTESEGRYAVCPSCRERQSLDGRPSSMRCVRCNGLFDIGWNESYLGSTSEA